MELWLHSREYNNTIEQLIFEKEQKGFHTRIRVYQMEAKCISGVCTYQNLSLLGIGYVGYWELILEIRKRWRPKCRGHARG